MEKNNDFDERYLAFGSDILKMTEELPGTPPFRFIASQLFTSGASVGARLQEARTTETRAEFVQGLRTAWKGIKVTKYWLGLIQRSGVPLKGSLAGMIAQCDEISGVLGKSVQTAMKNLATGATSPSTVSNRSR